jgi:hypothetical protein
MPSKITFSGVTGKYWNVGGTVWDQPYVLTASTRRFLDLSKGHYGYPDFPVHKDVGGPFALRYSDTVWGVTPFKRWTRTAYSSQITTVYDGIWAADLHALAEPTTIGSTRDGSAYGASAYNRMKPTKPSLELANSIFELRELPQMLRQRFHFNNLHELGDFHLAAQFGWLSLLRDVHSFIAFQRRAQKRLAWFLEHNGKPLRRKVILAETGPTVNKTGSLNYGHLTPTLVTQFYRTEPYGTFQTERSTKIWASARFRYYLPPGPRDIEWKRQMLRRIYGLRVTPRTVYKAIPWSWLVDWFSNLGQLIANMEPGVADRVAADYFYVMSESTSIDSLNVVGRLSVNYLPYEYRLISQSTSGWKSRIAGDPFGFNTSQNSLSGMQLSILGALGLSRLR